MSKKTFLAVGAALAALTTAAPAMAQWDPNSAPTPTPTPVQFAPEPGRPRSIIVTSSALTGGVRAARQGDNDVGVMTIEEFLERYPATKDKNGRPTPGTGIEAFEAIERENNSACAHTGEYVRRSLNIIARAGVIDERLQGFYPELLELGKAQNRASGRAVGGAVGGAIGTCIASLLFGCPSAVLNGAGYIGQIKANKKANKVDRDMRYVSVDQSRLQLDGMLLNMDATIGWANMVQDYCLAVFPESTLGPASAPTVPVTYGNDPNRRSMSDPGKRDGFPTELLPSDVWRREHGDNK